MSSEASRLAPWVAGMLWNKGGQSDPPDTNQQANDPNSWTGNIRPCRSFDPPELEKPVWTPYQQDETPISYLKSPPRPSPPAIYESTLRWFQPWNSRIQQQSPDSFIRMNLELIKTFSQSSQTLCHSSFGYQINQSWNLELDELTPYYASFTRYATPRSANCL
jgi:hypothetical protein